LTLTGAVAAPNVRDLLDRKLCGQAPVIFRRQRHKMIWSNTTRRVTEVMEVPPRLDGSVRALEVLAMGVAPLPADVHLPIAGAVR